MYEGRARRKRAERLLQVGKTLRQEMRIGFLTYDLQRNTEDALFSVAHKVPYPVKAFPMYTHRDQDASRVSFRPATARGKYLGVTVKGSTPEGFASNPEWAVGLACARESDVVILKGLFGLGAIWCVVCARLLGRVVVSTNQTLPIKWERKRRWWVRLAKRFLLGMCQFHIYQNPAAIEVLTTVYGCARERMVSAPFEGGAALFRRILSNVPPNPDSRQHFGFGANVIFLYAGNLHPFKGVSDIVRAAALLPTEAHFQCVFVGPEEPANKAGGTVEFFTGLARSLNIEHRVRFLAPVAPEELAELYQAADAVVLPTRKDCFPKVLVEAGLAGKPLITTNACGSAGVIVQDSVNGFVIEPGDPQELAKAMTMLLDRDLRETMGSRSKKIVDDNCSMDLEVSGYVEAIERSIAYLSRRRRT
jgi:glycosyltransferase involved in cell wall biosynthesis